MKSKDIYKEYFDNINISDETKEKLKDINKMTKEKFHSRWLSKVAIAVIALCVMTIGANIVTVSAYGKNIFECFASVMERDNSKIVTINESELKKENVKTPDELTKKDTWATLDDLLTENNLSDIVIPDYGIEVMDISNVSLENINGGIYLQYKLNDNENEIYAEIESYNDTSSMGMNIDHVETVTKNNIDYCIVYCKKSYSYEDFLTDLDAYLGTYYNSLSEFHSSRLYPEISTTETYEQISKYACHVTYNIGDYFYCYSLTQGINVTDFIESID